MSSRLNILSTRREWLGSGYLIVNKVFVNLRKEGYILPFFRNLRGGLVHLSILASKAGSIGYIKTFDRTYSWPHYSSFFFTRQPDQGTQELRRSPCSTCYRPPTHPTSSGEAHPGDFLPAAHFRRVAIKWRRRCRVFPITENLIGLLSCCVFGKFSALPLVSVKKLEPQPCMRFFSFFSLAMT